MRRVLVDPNGKPVYPTPGVTFTVRNMRYRIADDGDPDGDILVVEVIPSSATFESMALLPITSVR